MIAGSDTANGAASSLTDAAGRSASRITSARRVGSASAAKVRSSAAVESLTIWLSIAGAAALSSGTLCGPDGMMARRSRCAVDRNGSKKFRKEFVVKGAKRRLRRPWTLDNKLLSKHTAAVAIDGFL
jgi:hypothetical protein